MPGTESPLGRCWLSRRRSTVAWPLTWAYLALVAYASLYPFGPWRDQGLSTWSFLTAPWPRYWGAFDVWANVLGYGPLGFLAALSATRMGLRRQAWWLASGGAALVSLLMEGLQSYLPVRVPSVADFGLNSLGGLLGALLANGMERLGAIDRWSRFRERWFTEDAAGGMALLVLWPSALLFPASICLGLGQVGTNLRAEVAQWLQTSPLSAWVTIQHPPTAALSDDMAFFLVLLGLVLPCLTGFAVIRGLGQRVLFAAVALLVGVGVSALSAVLTYGPGHAWVWLDARCWRACWWQCCWRPCPDGRMGAFCWWACRCICGPSTRPLKAPMWPSICSSGSRAASSASMAWPNGWVGCGLMPCGFGRW